MKKTVLLVSQDRGSGNALYPVTKALYEDKNLILRVFVAKDSKDVFKKQGIPFSDTDNQNLNDTLDFEPDLIVTGTSMRECIEKEALRFARKNRIKTVTVLDFWGHYWERFTVDGYRNNEVLPDFICVMDDIAREQMVSEGFPEQKLVVTGNPYFDTFKLLGAKKQNSSRISVLYVSQPVFQNGSYQTDRNSLKDILKLFVVPGEYRFVIRPHPKDKPGAFDGYRRDNLEVETMRNISELIGESDIVIGKNSTALFEAVFRGKLVVSYQPVAEKNDRLITNLLGLSFLARSKSELEAILKKALDKQIKVKKLGVVKYFNDGKCVSRVIKVIDTVLSGISYHSVS